MDKIPSTKGSIGKAVELRRIFMNLVIVDYGSGNLCSVENALWAAGGGAPIAPSH